MLLAAFVLLFMGITAALYYKHEAEKNVRVARKAQEDEKKARKKAENAEKKAMVGKKQADMMAKESNLLSSKVLYSIASDLSEDSVERNREIGALLARFSLLFARRANDLESVRKSANLLEENVRKLPWLNQRFMPEQMDCRVDIDGNIALNYDGNIIAAGKKK